MSRKRISPPPAEITIAKLRAAAQKALGQGKDSEVYRIFGEMEACHLQSVITLASWRAGYAESLKWSDEAKKHHQRIKDIKQIKHAIKLAAPVR